MKKDYFFNNVLALLLMDTIGCFIIYLLCAYFDVSWLLMTIGWIIVVLLIVPIIVWKMQPKIQANLNKKVIENE